MNFNINEETIDTKNVNFINIIYIDDETMNVEINMSNGDIKTYVTKDEKLFEKLDKYCDICSEK